MLRLPEVKHSGGDGSTVDRHHPQHPSHRLHGSPRTSGSSPRTPRSLAGKKRATSRTPAGPVVAARLRPFPVDALDGGSPRSATGGHAQSSVGANVRSQILEVELAIQAAVDEGDDPENPGRPNPAKAHRLWGALHMLAAVDTLPCRAALSGLRDHLRDCIFSDYVTLDHDTGAGEEGAAGALSSGDGTDGGGGAADGPLSRLLAGGSNIPYFAVLPRVEAHITSAEEECRDLRAQCDALRTELEAAKKEAARARETRAQAEATAADHLVRIRNVETEVAAAYDRNRALVESQSFAEQQIESLEERLSETQALPYQMKNLKTIADGVEAKNEALKTELLRTLEELGVAREAMSTMLPEVKFAQLVRDLEAARKQNARINGQYAVLLSKHEALERELAKRVEAERSMTPRPDWREAQDVIGDLVDVQLASSRAKVAAAIQEVLAQREQARVARVELSQARTDAAEEREAQGEAIDRSARVANEDFFTGLGTGPDVPKYLRYTGRIQNRRIGKGEAEAFVRDVWEKKAADDRVQRKPLPLPDFFHKYLMKRYGRQAMVASWAYNLINALERYRYDKDLDMFLSILNGELSEEVYHDQNMMLDRVRDRLRAVDAQLHEGKESGVLPRLIVVNTLSKIFPGKSEDHHVSLRRALHRDAPGREIDYVSLFEDDEDFNQGDFAETLCMQHIEEIKEFSMQIDSAVQGLEQTLEVVRASDIRAVLHEVDPHKSGHKVEELIYRGLGKDPKLGYLAKHDPIVRNITDFLRRVHSGLVKRSNRAPSRAATASSRTKSAGGDEGRGGEKGGSGVNGTGDAAGQGKKPGQAASGPRKPSRKGKRAGTADARPRARASSGADATAPAAPREDSGGNASRDEPVPEAPAKEDAHGGGEQEPVDAPAGSAETGETPREDAAAVSDGLAEEEKPGATDDQSFVRFEEV